MYIGQSYILLKLTLYTVLFRHSSCIALMIPAIYYNRHFVLNSCIVLVSSDIRLSRWVTDTQYLRTQSKSWDILYDWHQHDQGYAAPAAE